MGTVRKYPSSFLTRQTAKDYVQSICFPVDKFIAGAAKFIPDTLISHIINLCSFPNLTRKAEVAYWLLHDLNEYPVKCKHCGKDITKFNSFNTGYIHTTCSYSCSNYKSVEAKRIVWRAKYGVDNPSQSRIVKDKIYATRHTNWWNSDRFKYEGFTFLCKEDEWLGAAKQKFEWKCHNCGLDFVQSSGGGRLHPRCPCCDKETKMSTGQRELDDWVRSVYTGPVVSDDKFQLKNLELDIWIPNEKLAIEFNGIYWHSKAQEETTINQMYHFEKTEQSKTEGIRLIHVFEHVWLFNAGAVKHHILQVLNLLPVVNIIDTIVKEVPEQEATDFLLKYHTDLAYNYTPLQQCFVGLYHNDVIIGIMTFNEKEEDIYIERCVFSVRADGGINKLTDYFQHASKRDLAVSVDRLWSEGKEYIEAGFTLNHITEPDYFYYRNVRQEEFISSEDCQHNKLSSILEEFDNLLDEKENMFKHMYRRAWDSGNVVLVKKYLT